MKNLEPWYTPIFWVDALKLHLKFVEERKIPASIGNRSLFLYKLRVHFYSLYKTARVAQISIWIPGRGKNFPFSKVTWPAWKFIDPVGCT